MANRLSCEFLLACQAGDLSRVETLTSDHQLENWTNFRHAASGDSPLHVAAREGHEEVVRFLCDHFEKPDFKFDVVNKDTKTPLHEAAQFSRRGIVKYLIQKGATVDALKRADWTPLMLACTKTGENACKCIETLLEANADLSLRNKDGWTPMHLICRSGNVQAFNILLKYSKESIGDRSNNGRSTMHIAAFHGHNALIDLLGKAKPELLAVTDSSGSTPLHEAIKQGNLTTAKKLIELGADVQAADSVGQTILHIAALTGNVETIKYILENHFADLHREALFGVTPLVAAHRSNQTNAIQCLINYGATK